MSTEIPLACLLGGYIPGFTEGILAAAIQAPKLNLGEIEKVEEKLLNLPQTECPIVERFEPGCYFRECTMPAGTFVIGHCHKTKHWNVVLSGRALVRIGEEVHEMKAGDVFESEVNVRKCLYIVETMRWMTIHRTNTTDSAELRRELIEPSEAWKNHELEAFQAQISHLLS